jgi:hypothetical protein
VRFLLDHDVDGAVGQMPRRAGHECWRAGEIGLATAIDDALTVWAIEHKAVLVSTDREFGQRKMRGRPSGIMCGSYAAIGRPVSFCTRDLMISYLDSTAGRR